MSPKKIDKDAKKQQIIQAAMQVFSEKGVVNTKMIDIAKAAGIGKGTIYEYFKNKDDIFINLFEMFFSQIEQEIVLILGKNTHPTEKLKQFVSLTVNSLFNKNSNFAEIMLDIWAEGIRERKEKINQILDLRKIYSEYRNIISKILQDGIDKGCFKTMDTTLAASLFIGSLDGIMLQWLIQKDLFDLTTLTDNIISIFVSGIEKA